MNYFNSIEKLKKEFKRISEKGWIKSVQKGSGSIGLTFEKELGITPNELEIPDFYGIEIKTRKSTSSSNTKLFNATFDGKYLFETKRLAKEYGWPDKIIQTSNVLSTKINGKNLDLIGKKWKMKLRVDYNKRKVFLEIYNKYNKFIEDECFWTFDLLEEKLLRKDKIIALIEADKMTINNIDYFYYHSLTLYKLKNFNTFLRLLDKGYIKVGIDVGVFRSGKKYGKPHDHGTSFEINNKDFELLYDKLIEISI